MSIDTSEQRIGAERRGEEKEKELVGATAKRGESRRRTKMGANIKRGGGLSGR
jgi:hypothetical protein